MARDRGVQDGGCSCRGWDCHMLWRHADESLEKQVRMNLCMGY